MNHRIESGAAQGGVAPAPAPAPAPIETLSGLICMVEFCWCAGAARVGCGPLITSELSHAAQIMPHINML